MLVMQREGEKKMIAMSGKRKRFTDLKLKNAETFISIRTTDC